jgi:small conductance mechanosensitive channel
MDALPADLTEIVAHLQELFVTQGLRFLGGLAVFVVGLIIAKSVRRAVRRVFDKLELDVTLEKFLTSTSYYVVLAVAAVAAMGMIGIEMASFITVLGAAGLAIGLALQGTLSNVSAGVMLLLFRPFKVGDWVDAGGVAGSVDSIGLFATILNTGDNVHIIVPNSSIYGGIIKNFSFNETRRNDMVVGVSYDDDIQLAMDTIKGVLDADERVLNHPEYLVAVSELADSSVNFVVRPWCAASDYSGLRYDLNRAFKEKLEAAGCTIPYPQQDVYVHRAD